MQYENIILVEGNDDLHTLSHLLRLHNLADIEVKDGKGVDTLLAGLPTRLRPGGRQRYGIVVDADADVAEELQLKARWQSIRDRLKMAGYEDVPLTPNPAGTIIEHADLPRIGVWLMPDNVERGMLEDFVALLMKENDLLWEYARLCVSQLPARRFKDSFVQKAEIHTWLAWQKYPGQAIGQAIRDRVLNHDAVIAQTFTAWVR